MLQPRDGVVRAASVAVLAALAFCWVAAPARAGITGKLSGVVRDAKRQPLAGANVAIPDARLGAVTDVDGRFFVLNVPAGTYTVRVQLIGYTPTTVQGVAIPADRTTTLDLVLQEQAVELKEVVVTARRPVVELGLTSNVATITRDQITTLPVQELQDVVNLQAGVVDGHFRGGRKGEVQYQVDGITVNNPYDNAASVRLDRSVLEEVQVISGTFDAEYGQAMSGVVNAVLRRGTERVEFSGETFQGDYVFPGADRGDVSISLESLAAREDWEFRPGNLQNYQVTLSGPTGLANTLFLLSGRHGVRNGFVEGLTRVAVWDRSADPDSLVPVSGEQVPIGYTRDWLGLAKLTNRSLPGVEVSYSAILNGIEARKEIWRYRYNVDNLARQRTFSAVHGLEWTHTLDPETYYRLSLRHNYFDYRDMLHEDVWDSRYDAEGPAGTLFPGFEYDAFLFGVDETRFVQRTNSLVFAGSFTRQLGKTQQVKAGIEWQPTNLKFGTPGHLSWRGSDYQRHLDEPENGYFAPATFKPVIGSIYAQDEIEWNDLRFRAGLRFEYFNPKSMVPGDFANPANAIEGAPYVPPRAATRKLTLAPRLGVSYPVTTKASLFFAYGHFYQLPKLGEMFSNANYSVLGNLQADVDPGTLGNPDIEPEKTIQYQFGYKQELRDWLGLDLTLFYKDIRNLLGSRVLITYNNAEYKQLANSDFGSVIGATLALDQRTIGVLSSALDYTWQLAKGNASDPYETAQRADAGEDARPRQVPLDWDQRHTLNLTVTLAEPQDFNVSGIFRAVSGQPYTPEIEIVNLEPNSGRKPSAVLVDLRAEKTLGLRSVGFSLFANLLNAFDTRFWNGVVYGSTGSPFYSRNAITDRGLLADPTRLHGPRRVEVGVRWEAGR